MTYAIVGVLALLMDQLLKLFTVTKIDLNTGIKELPGFLHLTHIKNFGAMFGVLQNAGWLRWVLLILLLAFTAAMVIAIRRNVLRTGFSRWTGTLLLAGLLGNGIDRAVCGYVVDMLEFDSGKFAIFNIADCLVLFAGILFCVSVITGGLDLNALRGEEEEEPAAAPARRPRYEEDPRMAARTRRPAEEELPTRQRPAAAPAARPVRPAPAPQGSTPVRTRPAAPADGAAPVRRPAAAPVETAQPNRVRRATPAEVQATAPARRAVIDETTIPVPTRARKTDAEAAQPVRARRPVAEPAETEAPVRARRPVAEPAEAEAPVRARRPVAEPAEAEAPVRTRRPVTEAPARVRHAAVDEFEAAVSGTARRASEEGAAVRRAAEQDAETVKTAVRREANAAKAAVKESTDEFDLDAILAEFK